MSYYLIHGGRLEPLLVWPGAESLPFGSYIYNPAGLAKSHKWIHISRGKFGQKTIEYHRQEDVPSEVRTLALLLL